MKNLTKRSLALVLVLIVCLSCLPIFHASATSSVDYVYNGNYLYNWGDDGYILYFYGADYNNKKSAPATFPVTLSADGNTLSIGACHSGAEFDYGVYRPSVFRDQEMWAVAISDIVLKRVK